MSPGKSYFDWECSKNLLKSKCYFEQGYTEGSEYNGVYVMDEFKFENEL